MSTTANSGFVLVSPPQTEEGGAERTFASLLSFPAPLIIVARRGTGATGNPALFNRFGSVRLDGTALRSSMETAAGSFALTLEPVANGPSLMVSAHATELADWHVLLVSDPADEINLGALRQLLRTLSDLENEASTDRLTGAWNRARFDRLIRPEVELQRNGQRTLTLVMFDIDYLKEVNLRCGREAGDRVLREVATLIRSQIRWTDELFRWGGDGFAVLLGDAGHAVGEKVADKILDAVEKHVFAGVGRVSLSAGVAERWDDEPLSEWLARVDASTYRAKTQGRNRVEVDRAPAQEDGLLSPALHLTWLERYECGEPTIDRQHRELFDRSNEVMNEVLRNGRNVSPMLDRLVAHISNHFADEEVLLERYGFPELEQHKRSHRELTAKALRMQESVRAGRAQLGELADFVIGQVVSRHLLSEDRRFASLFRGRKPGTGEG